ncbi:MAG: SIMPL domain-containing protein [Pegethrix bostrychoides GSE-TBD4-15B]|jgi:hypothetical protein|uniref:SIMPL domain-containing protein n=1 Tax=Pegethrix bostrychoides GSE-TBD4-15B TaxID=2839662 RepID=A0A951U5F8_9CYAN|nr:SIMPL domain-containing protein [Pegethrix bostrychoides GSE-TBD4-15B]
MSLVRSFRSLILVSCLSLTPLLVPIASFTRPAYAQQEQIMRTLTVRGAGKASVATTLTQVQLGVEVQGKTASEVQQQTAERSAAVVEFLRGRNVDKLQTTGISLNPQYDYANNRQQIIGYTASNSVSFRVPTEQAGDLLDQAVQAGATRIDSVSFVAEDAATEAARQQAIQQAVQNAQAQAQAVLSSLGLQQQEIVSIQVDGASAPPPMFARREALMADSAAPPASPVVGGEQEVQASVTLQIRY